MYKVIYNEETGAVLDIAPVNEEMLDNLTLEKGEAIWKGDIPQQKEGYSMTLRYVPEAVTTSLDIQNNQVGLIADYTPITGWVEMATAERVEGIESRVTEVEKVMNEPTFLPWGCNASGAFNIANDNFSIEVYLKPTYPNNHWRNIFKISNSETDKYSLALGLFTFTNDRFVFTNVNMATKDNAISFIGNLVTTRYNHIVVTKSGSNICLYVNGYRKNKVSDDFYVNNDSVLKLLPKELTSNDNISLFRTYNYALTQSDVDRLYNQGRPLDVKLGDEYRGINTESLPTAYNSAITVDGNKTEFVLNSGDIYCGCYYNLGWQKKGTKYNLKFNYSSDFDVHIRDLAAGNIVLSNGTGVEILPKGMNVDADVNFEVKSDGKTFVYICKSNKDAEVKGGVLYINELLKISSNSVTDEFTPQSLTRTKWLNTGVNKGNDIALTDAKFTYEPPVKERQWCLSTDTKPTPVAMGQELYTTDTGVIYKCKAKKNTEQFSVSHWKEI